MMRWLLEHLLQAKNNMNKYILILILLFTSSIIADEFVITETSKQTNSAFPITEVIKQEKRGCTCGPYCECYKLGKPQAACSREGCSAYKDGCNCTGNQGISGTCNELCNCGSKCQCENCTCHAQIKTISPVKVAPAIKAAPPIVYYSSGGCSSCSVNSRPTNNVQNKQQDYGRPGILGRIFR
jgi:hypothetical protein